MAGPIDYKLLKKDEEAWSRNVNKLLWKRRFRSVFDGPYHRDLPLLVSK